MSENRKGLVRQVCDGIYYDEGMAKAVAKDFHGTVFKSKGDGIIVLRDEVYPGEHSHIDVAGFWR